MTAFFGGLKRKCVPTKPNGVGTECRRSTFFLVLKFVRAHMTTKVYKAPRFRCVLRVVTALQCTFSRHVLYALMALIACCTLHTRCWGALLADSAPTGTGWAVSVTSARIHCPPRAIVPYEHVCTNRYSALPSSRLPLPSDPPPYNCYFVELVGTRKYWYCFSHKILVKIRT